MYEIWVSWISLLLVFIWVDADEKIYGCMKRMIVHIIALSCWEWSLQKNPRANRGKINHLTASKDREFPSLTKVSSDLTMHDHPRICCFHKTVARVKWFSFPTSLHIYLLVLPLWNLNHEFRPIRFSKPEDIIVLDEEIIGRVERDGAFIRIDKVIREQLIPGIGKSEQIVRRALRVCWYLMLERHWANELFWGGNSWAADLPLRTQGQVELREVDLWLEPLFRSSPDPGNWFLKDLGWNTLSEKCLARLRGWFHQYRNPKSRIAEMASWRSRHRNIGCLEGKTQTPCSITINVIWTRQWQEYARSSSSCTHFFAWTFTTLIEAPPRNFEERSGSEASDKIN